MAPDPNSPIRHFRADSPFIKSESAGVAQMYGRLHYEAEEGISPQILRKQAKGNFGKSQQAILCAKQIFFFLHKQATHGAGRSCCRGTAGGLFRYLL